LSAVNHIDLFYTFAVCFIHVVLGKSHTNSPLWMERKTTLKWIFLLHHVHTPRKTNRTCSSAIHSFWRVCRISTKLGVIVKKKHILKRGF